MPAPPVIPLSPKHHNKQAHTPAHLFALSGPRRAVLVFASRVGGSVDTAALSSKLVELAALLADRDAKVVQLNDFVKNR